MRSGEISAGYRLGRVLGRGSRAVVWEAVAEATGAPVALKVLDTVDPGAVEGLRREFEAQARLQHDNVVAVYDCVTIEGRLTLVAELVEGPDLRAWLEAGPPPRAEALRIFGGILRGLAAAHALGFVHRDLKPANILMAGGRVPKIADFGVVKTGEMGSSAGRVLGTFRYMAPEQLRDATGVDARADLFAAGCILYELLTGQRAFDAPNKVALMNAVRLKQHGPLPADLDPAVAAVLHALLDPDPAGRPGAAEDVLDALGLPHQHDEPVLPRPHPRDAGSVRLPLLLGAGALGVLALAAVAWGLLT